MLLHFYDLIVVFIFTTHLDNPRISPSIWTFIPFE